jgi:hypothetical protein
MPDVLSPSVSLSSAIPVMCLDVQGTHLCQFAQNLLLCLNVYAGPRWHREGKRQELPRDWELLHSWTEARLLVLIRTTC